MLGALSEIHDVKVSFVAMEVAVVVEHTDRHHNPAIRIVRAAGAQFCDFWPAQTDVPGRLLACMALIRLLQLHLPPGA